MNNDSNDNNLTTSKGLNIKKYVIIGAVAIVVVIIATSIFFGAKTLTTAKVNCSSKSDSGGIKIEQKYEIIYDKDAVKDVTIAKKFEYSDQTQFNAFKQVVIPGTDSSNTALENKYIKYESSTKDKTYSYTLEVNVNSASKDDVSAAGLDKSLKALKSNLENQGLVCK